MTNINPNTPMEEMTPGGDIYTAGNAKEFKTGDWRSMRPVFTSEKFKAIFTKISQFLRFPYISLSIGNKLVIKW